MHEIDSPDPRINREASRSYAEHYVRTHLEGFGRIEYALGYLYLVLIDGLLTDYRLLDVGCGTGGAYRLCHNYKEIIGIDFSNNMIVSARQLSDKLKYERVRFECEKFENFQDTQFYDVISLVGTFGNYQPWPKSKYALKKSWELLNSEGICVVSVRHPSSVMQWLKALIFFNKSTVVTERHFNAIVKTSGFTKLFSLYNQGNHIYFLNKQPLFRM